METPLSGDHTGLIVRLEGENAVVRFTRSAMCSHCGACMAVGEKELELSVPNALHAAVGDRVAVSIAPSRVLQASLLAYVIPLVLLIAGVWLGSRVSELFGLLLGVAGCGVAFLILRVLEKHRRDKDAFRPRMTALIEDGGEGAQP